MAKANHRAKLAELRALRQSGRTTFDAYRVDDTDALYDEVDEDGYKQIVRDRLNEDDFVVDDNGEGYADDGREDWDRPQRYDSESDGEDLPIRGNTSHKHAGKSREEKQKNGLDTHDRDISQYFTNAAAKTKHKNKVNKTKDDDDFMAGLLGEVDSGGLPEIAPSSAEHPQGGIRRKLRTLSPPPERLHKRRKHSQDQRLPSLHPPAGPNDSDDDMIAPPIDGDGLRAGDDVPMSDPAPSSPSAKVAERKARLGQRLQEEADGDDEMMEISHAGTVDAASVSVNMAASRPHPVNRNPPLKSDPNPSVRDRSSPIKAIIDDQDDSSSWTNLTERLNLVSSPLTEAKGVGKINHQDAVEADGSLNFFWLDYSEVNGSLCLFGKVLSKKTGSYVSCFLKIENIMRKLFFLPRRERLSHDEQNSGCVEMKDVYDEIDDLMTKLNVSMYKIKACTRKYAFELPEIPKETQYLKLLYPYTKSQLGTAAMTGMTYSHVFGSNASLFEQFVLWKNIMGPCWLRIQDANFDALKNASHCKLEVLAEHPDMVSLLSDSENSDAPPLTLMSVALRTAFNKKENKQEVLAISARIYDNVLLSDTTPAEKMPCRTFTVVRPHGQGFPLGFEQLARTRNRGLLVLKKSETDILSFFLAQLDVTDPDVVLGHQLEGVDYSILLNRLHEKKTHQWSRLGRLRRMQWPPSIGKVGGNLFAERQIIAGRLLCDLANEAGRTAMYKCQSWGLSEMCSLYLSGDNRRRDIDNEAALDSWVKEKQGLMNYITHMEADTYYIAALAFSVQLLPLTKILTNLAGNSWARTLTGTRAERNEFILLHEFHRNKYILPDKPTFRGRQRLEDEQGEEENGEGKKKDKYKGGLVFEPEKGLYDKFVLVMDFNSLYPSIIQEFNICFTTVDRTPLSENEDVVPEVPTDKEQGILPRLIATLVSRRRQVKSLMKDKTASPEQLATWDIKQLALKLTANSMYGCLGYTKSRFHARSLAVLTTYKGREILRRTKELAESKSLQVIYGDTDSVMINANVETVAEALRVGNEFKKAVNEQYRLLEIDIDNLFRRILLQAKKKYAAVMLVEKDGRYVEKMEVKGLDMRRREFCALSKEISKQLLEEILSGDETELSVARIHDYLSEMAGKMRAQEIPAAKYIIYTQLGKAPKDYPNGESMPQVQVALREMERGKVVRKGDVVAYVITGDSARPEPAAKRAFSPADLKADTSLVPDVDWYIGKQIFPPVERLCANIAGTSSGQLAERLGLELRRYGGGGLAGAKGGGVGELTEMHPLESQVPDEVRFAECEPLMLRCRRCTTRRSFEGVVASAGAGLLSAAGLLCGQCKGLMSTLSIVAQVEHAIRTQTSRYYDGWLVCDDAQCGNRTRQLSVYGSRCLGPKGLARDCLGRMRLQYSNKAIYNQLLYFASLWDVDKARARATTISGADGESILALAEHNRRRFGTVQAIVQAYLDKCGRQWVAMDSLFAKLGFHQAPAALET